MLSEEDKADVQTNIDKYSIDEIESKLSVICVRNKLDLSGSNENNHEEAETTFSLVDSDNDDESVPALVSALRKAKKNN
jgi:tRNA U34 5-carboxymethylaminomethyl modifying GTPase MnmE/TrmE